MESPRSRRPRPPAGRILLISVLCGATIGLLRVEVEDGAPREPSLDAQGMEVALADLYYRLATWLPDAATEAGLPGIARPTAYEEGAVGTYERLALRSAGPSPVASHRLSIIYGERGYFLQAHDQLAKAATGEGVDAEVCLALTAVYAEGPIDPTQVTRIGQLLARQPRWWALVTGARLAERIDAEAAGEALRQEARAELDRLALACAGVVAAALLLAVCAAVTLIVRAARYLFSPPRAPEAWPYGLPVSAWLDILDVAALVAFCNALAIVLTRTLLNAVPSQSSAGALVRVGLELLTVGPALGLVVARSRRGGTRWARALGLRSRSPAQDTLRGVVALGTVYLLVPLLQFFVGSHLASVLPAGLGVRADAFIADALLVVLVAPVLEEIVFRGYIYQALLQRMRPILAAFLCGVLFAGAHLSVPPPQLIALFTMGVVGAYIFRQSRSLLAPIVLHAGFNVFWLAESIVLRM